MRYRLTFITGVAVGYVLGTAAGRERYEQIRRAAQQFARNPAVRNAAESATQTGRGAASRAAGTVSDKVGHRMPSSVTARFEKFRTARAPQDDWGTSNT